METKLFEIRDRHTCIVAVGTLMTAVNPKEALMLIREGYSAGDPHVLLTTAHGGRAHYDPHDWADRTMVTAHKHIAANWHDLPECALIDVEVVLGEKKEPARTEFEL